MVPVPISSGIGARPVAIQNLYWHETGFKGHTCDTGIIVSALSNGTSYMRTMGVIIVRMTVSSNKVIPRSKAS